jgi:hypothetical protein
MTHTPSSSNFLTKPNLQVQMAAYLTKKDGGGVYCVKPYVPGGLNFDDQQVASTTADTDPRIQALV